MLRGGGGGGGGDPGGIASATERLGRRKVGDAQHGKSHRFSSLVLLHRFVFTRTTKHGTAQLRHGLGPGPGQKTPLVPPPPAMHYHVSALMQTVGASTGSSVPSAGELLVKARQMYNEMFGEATNTREVSHARET